ncbi:MAG: PAS domain-containing protein, partial [Nitrososphaerota archaeon]
TSFQVFKRQLGENVKSLTGILSSHIFKENNILFPAAQRVVSKQEWRDAQKEFDEIGYCCFTPEHLIVSPKVGAVEKQGTEAAEAVAGALQFETGTLSKEEVEAILNTLPVELTFVDKEDTVRYFSKAEKRIFVRTKAIIGRKVQLCHPQKSVHVVNRILDAFKAGKQDVAEFWIQQDNRLIHIRYFAVRDKDGRYLGTMEVTQDITDIKKIEGERRLLDWKE